MAVVLGRSQLLLYRNRDPEMGSALRAIERAALDAADTVRRIQAFSRAGHGASAAVVDLNDTVRESIDLTRARWEHEAQVRGAQIELVFEPGALPPVSGRNAELREVLTNLILNAVDALPRGGRLLIRTWDEPGRALVSITDSGPGMPEDVRGRAFEPFFTTKGVGKGTGLGLDISRRIVVDRHGGEIAIGSRDGETVVSVHLPSGLGRPGG
jgi:signal transduction histidine kinase